MVTFNIVPYEDKILCVVVPMDACHLLLWRPWKYNQSTYHDGRENTFEVQHNGNKYLLNPWKEEEASKLSALSLVTMWYKRFCKEAKHDVCYFLYPIEGRKVEEDNLSSEGKILLVEYYDVTPT